MRIFIRFLSNELFHYFFQKKNKIQKDQKIVVSFLKYNSLKQIDIDIYIYVQDQVILRDNNVFPS